GNEQALAQPQFTAPAIGAVMVIHEHIGAGLNLGVDATCRIEFYGSCAATGDGRAAYAAAFQCLDERLRHRGCTACCLFSVIPVGKMLYSAVISLYAAKTQGMITSDAVGQSEKGFRIGHAASTMTDVDLR